MYILRLSDQELNVPEQSQPVLYKKQSTIKDRVNGPNSLIPVAKLLSPRENCVFRNIAAGPCQAMDATAQVAVIWQDGAELAQRSELYIYEVPGSLWRNFRDRHSRRDSIYSIQTHMRNLDCCVEIQAKRVRSLDIGMGGIHLLSPLQNHALGQATLDTDDVAGLGVMQTGWDEKLRYLLPRLGLHIYVWGSSSSDNDKIRLSIFDISYSNPFLRTWPSCRFIPCNLSKIDPHVSDTWCHRSHAVTCQCALHDDGYHVELPGCPRAKATQESGARWSFFSQKEIKPTPAMDWGSVEHYFRPATQVALERKEEWMREQIRKMKRGDMTDDMIMQSWFFRKWTADGLVGLPKGWREITI